METIVVIDYGSQHNELLLRKLRDNGVYSLLLPKGVTKEKLEGIKDLKGIILSGGPHVLHEENDNFDDSLLELNVPILGICYGMELLAKYYHAEITSIKDREYDKHVVMLNTHCPLFLNIPEETVVYMSKNDKVTNLRGVDIIAESSSSGVVGFSSNYIYGVLFHPELAQTEFGNRMINNFIDICGCSRTFTSDLFIEEKIKQIKEEVGDEKVLLGLSGGLDSAVCALLLNKAIGDQLECIFIETGLHRKLEHEHILSRFEKTYDLKIHLVDEGELFLSRLKGVIDPEKKREVITSTFKEVLEREAKKLGDFKYYGQGTLYTDVKESKWGKKAKVVKLESGSALESFKVLEPLKDLTKDEVKTVGRKLGLDDSFFNIQPFPFPGLAIRIIGEVTLMKLEILREADRILHDEIKRAGIRKELYQYFCVLTNIDSTGIEGNNKIYYHTIAIRCVTSLDGINADFYHFDIELLARISRRIVNEVRGVNRVVYDITTKPPSTIEYQ